MKFQTHLLLLSAAALYFPFLNGNESSERPPKEGNFSLPVSQQPAALFGFGGNVIEEGNKQLYFFGDWLAGKKRVVSDLIPSFLYGVTDTFSVSINVPFSPLMKVKNSHSQGIEDCFVQLEYAYYSKRTYTYSDQATVLMNLSAPTGRPKDPPTGFGAPSLFFGWTYYRLKVDWCYFGACGAILPSSYRGTKFGNQYLYQAGVGRNIPSSKGWIFAWMFELDGQYGEKNIRKSALEPSSGGNVLFATPSLSISNEKFLMQLGVSFPVTQHWFGDQSRYQYGINLNTAYTF